MSESAKSRFCRQRAPPRRLLNETGVPELFVRRFPELDNKRLLSAGTVSFAPLWASTGNALVYVSATQITGGPDSIMRVAFEGTKESEGKPERMLNFYFSQPNSRFYDLSRRDDRLLMIGSRAGAFSENITVISTGPKS